jgi:N-acetylglucosamine-6-sulfatase
VFNIDGKAAPQTGYMTDLLTGQAVDFQRRRRGKPFSLFLAFQAVQGQPAPAEKYRGLYANETLRRVPSASDSLDGKPAFRRRADPAPGPRPNPDDIVRLQMQALASVDDGVGRILATLEELRQLDNTIVVFASDHGQLWGEHSLFDKRAPYDEATRIPLLIRYPRLIRPGTRLRNYVLNLDRAPTLIEISRANPLPAAKGRSLVPLLEGRARGWRTSFLSEYFEEAGAPRFPSWQAVRGERWKYIRYPNLEGADELYDLASDPYEVRNLIGDPGAQDALGDMRDELARLWRDNF